MLVFFLSILNEEQRIQSIKHGDIEENERKFVDEFTNMKKLPWRLLKWALDWLPASVAKKIEQWEKESQSMEQLRVEIEGEYEADNVDVSQNNEKGD